VTWIQPIFVGASNLLHISMLLRDLQWHDEVGVLAKTLSYIAQDL
jgi:hypothetical protein